MNNQNTKIRSRETKPSIRKYRRRLKGIISSLKMQKTAVVKVDRLKFHPKYKTRFRVTKKFKAHFNEGEYKVGDRVVIEETRPLSREKRWKIVGLVNQFQKKSKES